MHTHMKLNYDDDDDDDVVGQTRKVVDVVDTQNPQFDPLSLAFPCQSVQTPFVVMPRSLSGK